MRHPETGFYEFGPFKLEPGIGVTRGGLLVSMPPRALAALEVLVAQGEAGVSKDELAARAWATEHVSDETIAQRIHAVRTALGPIGRDFVKTIYGRGYRLSIPVRHQRDWHGHPSVAAKVSAGSHEALALFASAATIVDRGS
jgi:DNA-binding winged helix-turn-helix (wHTH) protein